jgi:Uma2 family endonuclease
MVTYGKENVAAEITAILRNWAKWNPQYGGRVTSSQGAFIIGHSRDVRIPDVAYTPRDIDRNLTHAQQWTYQGDPFCPSFVVEVDTLTGPGSQLRHLDHKMRNEYFTHGVQLGWLIDPEHQIMIEYHKTNARTRRGGVYASDDHSWRDLSGRETLPGFTVEAVQLDMVLNQAAGSSSEDEFEQPMVCPACGHESISWSQNTAHSEWHRIEIEKQKLRQRQQH